jgi:ABC-type multidrug transport system fused ATPase/permease subunit
MPDEDVHKIILDAALHDVSELSKLGREFLDGLYRGVAEPDKVFDEVEVCRGKDGKEICSRRPVKHRDGDVEVVNKLIEYYYLLSLYYYRRSDPYLSGIALGRTLHYTQDSSFMHTGIAERSVQEERMKKIIAESTDIKDICRRVNVESKTVSLDIIESLCIMYRRSVDTLNQFINEISRTPTRGEVMSKAKWHARKFVLGAFGLMLAFLMFIALFVIMPFINPALGFVIFILSPILFFIAFKIYKHKIHESERELAKLGVAKPRSILSIVKAMGNEYITIIPAY